MNKEYGIFKEIVEGSLKLTINDFGGYTYEKVDVEFPFLAKIVNFEKEECEVLNTNNGKKYTIYNYSIEEFITNKYSEYVWNALIIYFKIKFIIKHKTYQEEVNLIEEVEYLMQDIDESNNIK